MECKNTSTRPGRRDAFTLVELMVASALALVLLTAVATFSYFSSRSFVTMADYTDMNQQSQYALDKMIKEIRQVDQLTACTTNVSGEINSLTFQDANGNSLQFTYDANARELRRVSGGQTNTLLTDCDTLRFWIYQHTMISNTFDCYDPAYVTNARVIQVTWNCSRNIMGKKATTDNVQSAKIAIRNH